MPKETPEKLDLRSMDITDEKKQQLKQLFPEVFREDKIDFDHLKRVLGEWVDPGKERFGLQWPGKAERMKTIQQPSIATLRPDREESVNFDETENLFIEGDNLEVLKLLQKSYFGKVKMIYIDPPYNTGNEFIYPDNYTESLDTYLKYTGQKDAEGNWQSSNKETEGRFHSKWLNMMYPRLFLAKNLLEENGVIFVSIDDHEVHHLRKMMNEIYGEENFTAQIVWKKKTGSGSQIEKVFSEHEYVISYVKNSNSGEKWRITNENDGNFKNPDNDERGDWESCAITAPSKNRNPNQLYLIEVNFNSNKSRTNLKYDIIDEFQYGNHRVIFRKLQENSDYNEMFDAEKEVAWFIRRWAYIPTSMRKIFEDNRVYLNGANLPRYKKFQSEYEGKALRSIYCNEFSTQQGSEELRALFNSDIVEYPKPKKLLQTLVEATTKQDDIIVDFFAGSCSTADAILNLSNKEKVKRKFIMVQLPEITEEKTEAKKAGFETIADIGKERIRRTIKHIKEDHKKDKQLALDEEKNSNDEIDLGFKVFKLTPSNFKVWEAPGVDIEPEKLKEQLDAFSDHLNPENEEESILFELILKSGFPLTANIEKIELAGKHVLNVENGKLMICLAEELTIEVLDAISEKEPQRVICLDNGFTGDDADALKTNAVQLFKSKEIEFRTV